MRVEIQIPEKIRSGEEWRARALLFNDSYQPVIVFRNAFIGPCVRQGAGQVAATPLAVEPTYGHQEEQLTLPPFTFYGRERLIGPFPPGEVELVASYRDSAGVSITASKRVPIEAE